MAKPGRVWFVGAGPGDPELMTLLGQELLREADVVVHDAALLPELFDECRADAKIIDSEQIVGASQTEGFKVAELIVQKAQAGAKVIRLNVGDPLLCSRTLDEIKLLLSTSVPFEIVPGVASPQAAAAYSGLPLHGFERRPLFRKRLLLCRPLHQTKESARAIRRRGAEPVILPLIEIAPIANNSELSGCIKRLSDYDWVILTSSNGAEQLLTALASSGLDARAFGRARIAVIGPGTAKPLEKWGLLADLIADEHVAEGLARQLLLAGPAQRALLVRALEARDALPKALEAAGLRVDVVAAYETRTLAQAQSPTLKTLLESGNVDAVLLTSSSMAESLIEALGPEASTYLSKLCVASIGPITTATLERLGVPVSVTANTYTVAGLLDALETYYLGG